MNNLVSINGKIFASENAKISVLDRGFRFGDGVFETIRIVRGVTYLWSYHINRLFEGLRSLKIKISQIDIENINKYSKELIVKNNVQTGFLRISISRGIGSRGYVPTQNIEPIIVMETMSNIHIEQDSVSLFLSNYEKISTRALPIKYKLMQGLNSTLARIEAEENQHFEALLLNYKNHICEVSSGNIFWFNGKNLCTPSIECGIVSGVIRKRIIELSPYRVEEGEYTLNDLKIAKSVFITNVNWLALSVNNLSPNQFTFSDNKIAQHIKEILIQDQNTYV